TIDPTSTFGLTGQNTGFGTAVASVNVESPTVLVVNLTGVYALGNDVTLPNGETQTSQILTIDLTFPTVGPPPVPEPSTWAMMLLGFAGLGFIGYRRTGVAGAAVRAG